MRYAYGLHSFFEDTKPEKRACDFEGCSHAGEFKAPKGRYRLREYFWFCLEHVKAYNEKWNYYGANENPYTEESFDRSETNLRWKRPPWLMNRLYGMAFQSIDVTKGPFHPFRMFDRDQRSEQRRPFPPRSEEAQALDLLNLTWPIEKSALKVRYIELVKRYHPDKNGGCPKSENKLKEINKAYEVLKRLLAKIT